MSKRIKIMGGVLFLAAVAVIIGIVVTGKDQKQLRPVKVQRESIKITTQATGTIEPMNKVEILPPVSGRIDKILVDEGRQVKKGDIIAWMSSTNRAVLLDLARTKGKKELKNWEKMYQPTPITAPVSGLIINKMVVPGQTVNQQTPLFEMSDRLVVRAYVDETDIGKITIGMIAEIGADAFADKRFVGQVKRIGHQSELINNVNVYEVELEITAGRRPTDAQNLRSGMTANITFILEHKKDVLVVPVWAVQGREREQVSVMDAAKKQKKIELGLSNGRYVEVLSNVTEGETLFVEPFVFKEPEIRSFPFSSTKKRGRSKRNK